MKFLRSLSSLLRTFMYRSIPVIVVGVIVFFLVSFFSSPQKSYTLIVLISILLAFSSYYSYGDKHTFLGFLGLFLLLLVAILGAKINFISELIFVYITGLLGVIGSVGLAIMSFFVGREISRRVQHFCLAVALLSPIITSILVAFTGNYSTYMAGVMASVCASSVNMFWNKADSSIGVPGSKETPQSPSSPVQQKTRFYALRSESGGIILPRRITFPSEIQNTNSNYRRGTSINS